MDALRRDIHIPRAFTALLLWASEILQDFRLPKQALINAFYNYVRKPINRITGAKVVIFCEMNKCLRRKLKIIVIYKDLHEWDSGLIDKEACIAFAANEVHKVKCFRK